VSDFVQVDIETEIGRLNSLLEHATQLMAKRVRERAECRVRHKVAYARAYLGASGAVEERKQTAVLTVENELRALEVAEAVTDAAQEAGRNLREQLQGLRSINANHRHLLINATGVGG